jgi:biotin carboxyl carrier protein
VAEVERLSDGWYLVRDGEKSWRVAIADAPDGPWVFVDGQVARIEPLDTDSKRRPAKGRGESGVMAPMPATVVALNTAAGQPVKEGETLIVLEAMKMELPIKSPRSGRVKAVHCAKGDLVQPGVILVEIE